MVLRPCSKQQNPRSESLRHSSGRSLLPSADCRWSQGLAGSRIPAPHSQLECRVYLSAAQIHFSLCLYRLISSYIFTRLTPRAILMQGRSQGDPSHPSRSDTQGSGERHRLGAGSPSQLRSLGEGSLHPQQRQKELSGSTGPTPVPACNAAVPCALKSSPSPPRQTRARCLLHSAGGDGQRGPAMQSEWSAGGVWL